MGTLVPAEQAAVFSVKPGTAVYSKPQARPEVRVHVPTLKDTAGFCQFKQIYKIVDRENPEQPATGWASCVSIDQLVPN